MEDIYLRNVKIMSAFFTSMRLQILDMPFSGELCTSRPQDVFSITQPSIIVSHEAVDGLWNCHHTRRMYSFKK